MDGKFRGFVGTAVSSNKHNITGHLVLRRKAKGGALHQQEIFFGQEKEDLKAQIREVLDLERFGGMSMTTDELVKSLVRKGALAWGCEEAPLKREETQLKRQGVEQITIELIEEHYSQAKFMIEGTSRYNSTYYCNASISFVKGESPDMSIVKVQYQVRGDNSLGPLQDPEDSSLSVDSRKLRPVRTRRDRESPTQIEGHLEYEAKISVGSRVDFTFGSGGYSSFGATCADPVQLEEAGNFPAFYGSELLSVHQKYARCFVSLEELSLQPPGERLTCPASLNYLVSVALKDGNALADISLECDWCYESLRDFDPDAESTHFDTVVSLLYCLLLLGIYVEASL